MRISIKRALCIVVLCCVAIFALLSCQQQGKAGGTNSAAPTIGILYTEPHPVLTTIIDAFKKRVLEQIPNAKFIERHGSGSKTQYPAAVRAVIAENVQLIVPVTTPMSIEAYNQTRGSIPMVFLGVTDPVGAGLVDSLALPGLCTGVSDNPPMDGAIDVARAFLPKIKTLGIPYDPKDQPGVVTANRAQAYATSVGIKAELRPVTSETELNAAVRSLASTNDAILIGMDNLMMKNAGLISRTAIDQKKPLFAADDKSVEMGALAGVGVDYADVGKLGGDAAIEILLKKLTPGSIPVKTLHTGQIFYNSQSAKDLGLPIPASIAGNGKDAASVK